MVDKTCKAIRLGKWSCIHMHMPDCPDYINASSILFSNWLWLTGRIQIKGVLKNLKQRWEKILKISNVYYYEFSKTIEIHNSKNNSKCIFQFTEFKPCINQLKDSCNWKSYLQSISIHWKWCAAIWSTNIQVLEFELKREILRATALFIRISCYWDLFERWIDIINEYMAKRLLISSFSWHPNLG